jgi:hypothetical protein
MDTIMKSTDKYRYVEEMGKDNAKWLFTNAIYLENEVAEYKDYKFFGTPYSSPSTQAEGIRRRQRGPMSWLSIALIAVAAAASMFTLGPSWAPASTSVGVTRR